jgi:hypothetical protein
MSLSKKQLLANRRNAKKGGVKTSEGKSLTRLNAVQHGLLSQEVLLEGESDKNLFALEEGLLNELQPQGELERILVDCIVSSMWRLKRTLTVERAHMEYEHEDRLKESYFGPEGEQKKRLALVDMLSGDTTEKIMRYETAIEKQIYRALHELIRLQMARQGEKPPAPIAIDLEVSQGN